MDKLTLYDISSEYLQALDTFTDPGAEIPLEAAMDTLEGIEGQLQDKAVNVAKFMQNLSASINAIKAAEEQMARRRKALENRARWIRDYLKFHLESVGISKIDTPWFQLAIQKNPPSVEVTNEACLPDAYVTVDISLPRAVYEKSRETLGEHELKGVKIDRSALKRALNKDAGIPGAKLVNGTRLVVR